jgi:hydantoinase/carbamoylase family amidase
MQPIEQRISPERMAARLDRLAEIGGLPGGGMNRLSYSPEDRAARELLAEWLSGLGLRVWVDGAGNLIGEMEGADPMLPVVMAGSHLDTQPEGGRYDGIAGVVAALESVEAMREAGFAPRHSIQLVSWAAEEVSGSYDLSMIGSRAMIGAVKPEDLEARNRLTGVPLREAMREAGVDLAALPGAERPAGSVKAVVELHIEQGPHLERAKKPLGVVTHVAGAARLHCTLRGQQAHSGAMPMEGRRDALCGMADVLLAVEAAAREQVDPPVVATIGYLDYGPRAVAIVPGRATAVIDVRSVDTSARDAVVSEIESQVRSIARRRKLQLELRPAWSFPPARMDPEVVATIERACREVGAPYQAMPSGAGHDAMTLGRRFPAGMIFVPSVGGISHAPEEFTPIEELALGARVLARTLALLSE